MSSIQLGGVVRQLHRLAGVPAEEVHDLFNSALYPEHPLGRDVLGLEGTVRTTSREQVVDFHRRHYRTGNIVVTAAGNGSKGSGNTNSTNVPKSQFAANGLGAASGNASASRGSVSGNGSANGSGSLSGQGSGASNKLSDAGTTNGAN